MPWVKLDEDFASHPKVLEAGPLGVALQVAALCYCNRHLTDGHISRPAARSLLDFEGIAVVDGMRGDDVDADYVIGCVLMAGLWHGAGHDCPTCPPVERGYIIHDYLEQQPSREDVMAKREQTAAAGRKGGQARAKRNVKRNASGTLSETEADRQAKVQAESKPVPVPVPQEQDQNPPSDKPDEVDDEFESFWTAYPRHHDTKALGGGGVKKAARKAWDRLSRKQRDDVIAALEPYAKVCRPDGQKPKNAERFLKNDAWTPYLPAARDGPRGRPCPECDRDLDKPDHDELCAIFSGKELV